MKSTREKYTQKRSNTWLFDRNFHILHNMDRNSMEMCSPPLLCPSSISPIQRRFGPLFAPISVIPTKMSLRNCHIFALIFRAIQQSLNQHSIHHDSNHHQTKKCPCKNCQNDTSVQILVFLKLFLLSGVQDNINQLSKFLPLYEPFALMEFVDFPTPSPSLPFPLRTFRDHDLLGLLFVRFSFAWEMTWKSL